MNTFYCVTSAYYSDGRVEANITDMNIGSHKPTNTFVSLPRCDVYVDWFDSYEEAEEFCQSA